MIGIIGYGRFGKLMAGYLARDFDVLVWDPRPEAFRGDPAGAVPAASLAAVCARETIILAVPISTLYDVLVTIAPMVKPDALVMDVCSVKLYPTRWMRDLLPETVSILPTHPMFGPDSAAESLSGRKIVLCRERVAEKRYEKIRRYLISKGLSVIETDAREHDRQIADSLCVTHFIGRSLSEFGAGKLAIDTEGYNRLLHVLEVVEHDSWQLFLDMNRYNPFAKKRRTALMEAMKIIEERLGQ